MRRLPVGEEQRFGREPPIDADRHASVAHRVLLVDDDEREATLIEAALERVREPRYRLDWVGSYAAGLSAITRGEHDVYLVDYRLGAADGGAADGVGLIQEAIRAGCRSPLILLTGAGNPRVDAAALEVGAADYLVKGETSPALLDRTLRYAIAAAQERESMRRIAAQVMALDEVGRLIAVRGPTSEVLRQAVDIISSGFEYGCVALFVYQADWLVLEASRGYRAPLARIDPHSGALRAAVTEGRPRFMPSVTTDPDRRDPGDPRVELCVPLMADGSCVGVLMIGHRDEQPLAHIEHSVILAIGDRLANAIEVSNRRVGLSPRLASAEAFDSRDRETGLLTRPAFEAALEHRLAVHYAVASISDIPVAALLFGALVERRDSAQVRSALRALVAALDGPFGSQSLAARYDETHVAVVAHDLGRDAAVARAEACLSAARAAASAASATASATERDSVAPPEYVAGCAVMPGSAARARELLAAAEMAEALAERVGGGAVVAA